MSSTTAGAAGSGVTLAASRGSEMRHTCEPPVSLVRKLAASSEPSGHMHSVDQAQVGCTAGSPRLVKLAPPSVERIKPWRART